MGKYGDIAREVLSRSFPLETIDTELTVANTVALLMDIFGEELRFIMEQKAAQHYISTSYGVGLSLLGTDMYDLPRKAASAARVTLQVTRASSAGALTVPSGTVVRDALSLDKFLFDTDVFWEDSSSGMQEVTATADRLGPNNLHAIGSLVVFDSGPPETGMLVTNAEVIAGGNFAESEANYKERIRQQFQTLTKATEKAITLAVSNIPQIKNYFVYVPVDTNGNRFGRTDIVIADESGYGNSTIAAQLAVALQDVTAAGEYVNIISSLPVFVDISVSVTWQIGDATVQNKQLLEKLIRGRVNLLPPNGGNPAPATLYTGIVESLAEVFLPITSMRVILPVGSVAPNMGEVIRAGKITIA